MRDLRLILAGSERHRPIKCQARGCSNHTSERKPWCSDHILTHSPYARALARIEEEFPSFESARQRRQQAS